MHGYLHISCSNAASFIHALAFIVIRCNLKRNDLPGRIPNPPWIPASERLVCARIRSIRGTRLLPPDIEREFTCTGRPSSELILTCHSVKAYIRSQCVFSLPLPIRPSKASNPLTLGLHYLPKPSAIYQESSLFRQFTCRFNQGRHILTTTFAFRQEKFDGKIYFPKKKNV